MRLPRQVAWLAPPLLVGAFLRLYNLPNQLLVGDEIHSLRAMLAMPVREILVTYRATDYCQPLTAIFRLLLDLGVPLSEMHLRAPSLLAGLGAVFALPFMARRWTGRSPSVVWAWLIACSPVLVLYSRVARSYAPATLVAGVSVLAFFAWLERPSARRGLVYALTAPVAVYLHLVSAPMVAAPFLYAFAEKILARRPGLRWRSLFGLGGASLAGLASFLVPSWPSLSAVLGSKRVGSEEPFGSLASVMELQAGVVRPSLVALFWVAAAIGLFRLIARRPRFGIYTLVVALVQLTALLVIAPFGSSIPFILNRYLLVVTPLLLLWVAVAVAGAARAAVLRALTPWRRVLTPTFVAAFVLAFLVAGPFADPAYRRTSWLNHSDFMDFQTPLPSLSRTKISPIFSVLEGSRSEPILHLPVRSLGWASRTPYLYQQIHRRPVMVSGFETALRDRRLGLRNFVIPGARNFLESDARYLVLHKDREREEARIRRVGPHLVAPRIWEFDRKAARRVLRELRAEWGKPDLQDADLAVWDLDRLRAEAAPEE